jgi:hypothetical protein
LEDIPFDAIAFIIMKAYGKFGTDEEQRTGKERSVGMMNNGRLVKVHLHGHCKVSDEEEKPLGIGCIGPSEGEMRECDTGQKKKSAHDQMASTS